MDPHTRRALEAILFVVDEPVDVSTLCQVLEQPRDEVETALRSLREQFEAEQRGFALREVAGGWRFYTAPDAAPYIERWVLTGRSGRLTQAALETLAVIAYKQPIARQEVGEVRGVNAEGAIRTLVARGLVEEVGRDPGPGQAILYGTTDELLEKLGLSSLDDLPALTEFLPEGPAPDEPGPELTRAARKHLQDGRDLPATGRARWDPLEDEDDDLQDEDERGPRGGEMDALTDALDRAARSAMATLEQALQAVEQGGDADGGDDTEPDVGPVTELDHATAGGHGDETRGDAGPA